MVLGKVSELLAFCVVPAALSGAICWHAQKLGEVARLLDRPDGTRKLHRGTVPLVGGLAVLVPSFAACIVYVVWFVHVPVILVAVAAAIIMLLIGVADDRAGLSAAARFLTLVPVICLALFANPLFVLHALRFVGFGYEINIPLGTLAWPITVLMLVGFINAVNMADGMNGVLLGSIAIWCTFVAMQFGQVSALPFVIVASSALVTLAFNLRGRIFSGSAGSYAAALFIGLGAIAAYRTANGAMSADLPLVWFWLPVIDCLRVMVHRAIARRSPLSGDRNHLHHILLEQVPQPVALAFYFVLLAAPGISARLSDTFGATVLLMCLSVYATTVFFHLSLWNRKLAAAKNYAVASPDFDRLGMAATTGNRQSNFAAGRTAQTVSGGS